jgi:uncharacterized protein YndB with AHSA1/START domain
MTDAKAPLGAGYEMTLVRTFKAPASLVFDCFTNGEHLARWWGPRGFGADIHKIDARPGGELSLQMVGMGYDHLMGGEYVEIERPRRLVFRTMAFEAPDGGWGIVNRNTLTFEEHGGFTTLTLHTLVEKAEGEVVLGALAGMEVGWSQSIDKLIELVAELTR